MLCVIQLTGWLVYRLSQALATPLVGFFEKRRLAKFVKYVQDWEADKPATHQVSTRAMFRGEERSGGVCHVACLRRVLDAAR